MAIDPRLTTMLFVEMHCRMLLLNTRLHNLICFVSRILFHVVNINLAIAFSTIVFGLVAISQPIMEVVPKLFQNIHVIANLSYQSLLVLGV